MKTIGKEQLALIYLLTPAFLNLFPASKFSYQTELARTKMEHIFLLYLWKLLLRNYFAYIRNIPRRDTNKHFQGY